MLKRGKPEWRRHAWASGVSSLSRNNKRELTPKSSSHAGLLPDTLALHYIIWLDALDHVAAGGGTIAAGRSAFCHMFVVGELSARGGAFVARLGTSLANNHREHALPGRQLGGRTTNFGAIDAKIHCPGVILVPLDDQPGAMVKAGSAFLQALGASLGASLEVLGMFGMGFVGQCPVVGNPR
jgi:hypothetical protein